MNDQLPKQPQTHGQLNFWRVAGTIFSLGLLVYLIWLQGWDEFAGALRQIPFSLFLVAMVLAFASRFAITLRWHALLRSADVKISFAQSLRLVFMGLFASNFLPSTVGGDLVRLAGVVYLRIDAGIGAASLVVDRLVGMAGMALMLPMGISSVLGPQAAPLGARFEAPAWVMAAGVLPRELFHRVWKWAMHFLKKLISSTSYWLKHPTSLALPFLFTLIHMLMTFLIIKIFLDGMGEPLSIWQIGGLWSLSYFFSLLPISVNGLGLQEISIAYLYSDIGGVSSPTALALAVLVRMVFVLCSLPGVFFLSDILRPLPKMGHSEHTSSPAP